MRRPGTVDPALSGVAETLLIPVYNRAMESQRPDAIMKDEKAVALVTQMSYDFDQPEPRMNPFRWIAPVFRFFKPTRIFHFQLGEAAGQESLCAAYPLDRADPASAGESIDH